MPAIRSGAEIAFGIVLVIVQIGDTYLLPRSLTDKTTVIGIWVSYTLFVLIPFGVAKIGNPRKITRL